MRVQVGLAEHRSRGNSVRHGLGTLRSRIPENHSISYLSLVPNFIETYGREFFVP